MDSAGRVYRGRARAELPAPAARVDQVPGARWAAYGRALLRGHYARADGRCGCGHWATACDVRVLARQHGIPLEPALRGGRHRMSPAG